MTITVNEIKKYLEDIIKSKSQHQYKAGISFHEIQASAAGYKNCAKKVLQHIEASERFSANDKPTLTEKEKDEDINCALKRLKNPTKNWPLEDLEKNVDMAEENKSFSSSLSEGNFEIAGNKYENTNLLDGGSSISGNCQGDIGRGRMSEHVTFID